MGLVKDKTNPQPGYQELWAQRAQVRPKKDDTVVIDLQGLEDTKLAMPALEEDPTHVCLSPAELEWIRIQSQVRSFVDRDGKVAKYQLKLNKVVHAALAGLDPWKAKSAQIRARIDEQMEYLEGGRKSLELPAKDTLLSAFKLHAENIWAELCGFFGLDSNPSQLGFLRQPESMGIFVELFRKAREIPASVPKEEIPPMYRAWVTRVYCNQLFAILNLPSDAEQELLETKYHFFARNPAQLREWKLQEYATNEEVKQAFAQKVRGLAERICRWEILTFCFDSKAARA